MIAPQNVRGQRLIVNHHAIDHFLAGVPMNGAHVIGQRVTERLARLGHEVRYIDARGAGLFDGFGHAGNQEIGNDAGEKRARAEEDQVGGGDGLQDVRQGLHSARNQAHAANGSARGADSSLAGDHFAIFERGFERDQLIGGGEDAPANGQHFAAHGAPRG